MHQISFRTRAAACCAVSALALGAACGARAESLAGTAIVNVARLTFATAGRDGEIASNESRIVVAERLDVALVAGPVADAVVSATLTNQGNGQEAFSISASASAGADRIVRVAIDGDGDGRYDPAHDPDLAAGRTPVLAPGQGVTVFVVTTPDTTGTVAISATAATGSGAPGTVFAGAGDAGGDAVTGPTGAAARITVPLGSGDAAAPTLTKTAAVTAPDGSARAVRGATVTYTLVARFPAATTGPRIADAIPAGTAYVPASLSLDDAPLSDAADADVGDATPQRIAVALGDQATGAARTVRFKVVIQ